MMIKVFSQIATYSRADVFTALQCSKYRTEQIKNLTRSGKPPQGGISVIHTRNDFAMVGIPWQLKLSALIILPWSSKLVLQSAAPVNSSYIRDTRNPLQLHFSFNFTLLSGIQTM